MAALDFSRAIVSVRISSVRTAVVTRDKSRSRLLREPQPEQVSQGPPPAGCRRAPGRWHASGPATQAAGAIVVDPAPRVHRNATRGRRARGGSRSGDEFIRPGPPAENTPTDWAGRPGSPANFPGSRYYTVVLCIGRAFEGMTGWRCPASTGRLTTPSTPPRCGLNISWERRGGPAGRRGVHREAAQGLDLRGQARGREADHPPPPLRGTRAGQGPRPVGPWPRHRENPELLELSLVPGGDLDRHSSGPGSRSAGRFRPRGERTIPSHLASRRRGPGLITRSRVDLLAAYRGV